MAIEFLDPESESGVEQIPYDLRVDLHGTPRVLFLANGYVDSLATLEALAAAIGEQARLLVEFRSKGTTMIDAAKPLSDHALTEITASFDAVVTAYGHCGSCTSATTRDGVAIARRGRPVVVLVTEKFLPEARLVARAGGLGGLPIVALTHPMAGLDDQRRASAVAAVVADVLDALAGAPRTAGVAAGVGGR